MIDAGTKSDGTTETEPRTAQGPVKIHGTIVQPTIYIVAAQCECGEVMQFNDPEAVKAFATGKALVTDCRKCMRRVEITKPLLVQPNHGPNRHDRRAAAKIKLVQ